MYGKIALSFATAALILAAGGFLAVWNRLGDPSPSAPSTGRSPGSVATRDGGSAEGATTEQDPEEDTDPLASDDPLVKLNWIIRALDKMASNDYETYTEHSDNMYALKRQVRQLKGTLRQIINGLGKGPGGIPIVGWGLASRDAPITPELKEAYRTSAAELGVQVEDGRVTVRGFLNFSPRVNMPIEYFITRFPESNHETLVHLIGNRDLDDLGEQPHLALRGLATALYKGMIAAGFEQGEPGHPDMKSDEKDPLWLLATGQTVYIAVRYEHEGKTHVARATDWIIDPVAGSVLPPDCFRFTGGTRMDDHDTGEEVLAAEAMGLLVSVWPTFTALVEVALESSRRNDYSYNFERIPKKAQDEGLLYLDVIFSTTPVELEGDGAKPLPTPPAGDTGLRRSDGPDGDGDAPAEDSSEGEED